jgi:hypothetical protein
MGLQNYTPYYSTDGVTWAALNNVQSMTISIGRQAQLDQYNASTASFTIRYPYGYSTPNTAMVSGTNIKFVNQTSGQTLWVGKINDVVVRYGIPYSGGVGNADYLDVTCEATFAVLGRMQGQGYSMAANTLSVQMSTASTQTGTTINWVAPGTSSPTGAATTINSTWGDWLNRTALTYNARLWDGVDVNTISVVSPFNPYVSSINFSDTTNNDANQVYDQIDFHSLADNFYTQVTVTPESFTAATATKTGATVPYRTYQVNTLSSSTAQATDQANYLLSNYQTAKFAIGSVSCLGEAQNFFRLDQIGFTGANNFSQSPGTQVSVAFRGTTYQCVIEGASFTATPAESRYTFYLSGADLNNYLILGNTVFGTLDYNKLGY